MQTRYAAVRWAASAAGAFLCTFLFLKLVVESDSPVSMLIAPVLQLDFITLPPEPTLSEKPRSLPQRGQKPIPAQIPVEPPPPARAPIEPSPTALLPGQVPDMTSSPSPVHERKPVHIVSNIAELDNADFAPRMLKKPAYPWIAREADIEGFVDIELLVTEQGAVESYKIRRTVGHRSFADETRKVLPMWRFPPPRINGQKTKVRYTYRMEFKLD